MMMKETKMITTFLDGGSFENRTGCKWTAGLSRFHDGDALKIRWEQTGPVSGRWFFEISGIQYSAKKISPRIENIQMHG